MMNPQYAKNVTTPTGTDLDTYLPTGTGAKFNTTGYSGVYLVTHRTSEAGTCTLQGFFEFLDFPSNVWYPWLDANDATQIQTVIYADAALDTTTPFHRYTVVTTPELLDATNANRVELVNTVHKIYMAAFLPTFIRVRFRSGGTTVSNVFNATLAGIN